ncbi:uncharacterized protein LOC111614872 [Centruroides sculpturatus]|uniref:uncharacterized protein LOC111614872 n=1 Tax=Centruroides sculpturatus TaxID=218467 RepID=UPI000C6E2732|nr:uncharacterized protein LOC111614872 [Centruroides sculpturatus]
MHMANTHQADILVVQEPYCYDNEIALFSKLIIFSHKDPAGNPKTSIIMINKSINAHQLTQHTGKNYTTIIIKLQTTTMAIISFYCSPSEDITHPLEELQETMKQLKGIHILVAGDFNAKSQIWHSPVEDPRGYKVIELINSLNLHSMNTCTLATYSSSTGESWVAWQIAISSPTVYSVRPSMIIRQATTGTSKPYSVPLRWSSSSVFAKRHNGTTFRSISS